MFPMRPSDVSSLGLAAVMAIAAATAVVSPASALTHRLSDTAFLATARCAGLAEGLGSDPKAFDKVVDDQIAGRESFIADRASETRQDAARQARHAGADVKARLSAERDGVCQGYLAS
jgi:hypothetical protein